MKHQQLHKPLLVLMMMSCLCALTGVTTRAQSTTLSVAEVPFQFNVGKQTLPAGKYAVSKIGIGTSTTLRLTDASGKHVAIVPMSAMIPPYQLHSEARWIFNRYGDQYFLSQVWMDAKGSGFQLTRTRVEKRMAKSLNAAPSTEVSIKLNQQ